MTSPSSAIDDVKQKIAKAVASVPRANADQDVILIAVSKTYDANYIREALKAGHRDFGENRVQEAQGKWPDLKAEFPDVRLHLIGPLQTNKVPDAVALFDVIHTVDRPKLVRKLGDELSRTGKSPALFVQVNTGAEEQKAGVLPKNAVGFIHQCKEEFALTISGLMCIPPVSDDPAPHFALLRKLAGQAEVENLSMGMSADFEQAVRLGATHVRVGSAIFGARK